ncbi:sialic acid-binding Ig-like lectin 12 isoform 2-T2 [Menidia menidia]
MLLIWVTGFVLVTGSRADTGNPAWGKQDCLNGYCITLREGEITAEAGLYVVIPCSFKAASDFTAQHLIWYKCVASQQRCRDSDIIFHSNDTNKSVASGLRGRVSLLEPDVSQKNCSIVINDVVLDDTGSYQLRIIGLLNGKTDAFTFNHKAIVSVRGYSAWGKQDCLNGYCITLREGEITAEAGLCVVIPCSFKAASDFTAQHLIWYKCDASQQRCRDSDIIFHSKNKKVQVEYEGRVSLLEPDVSQRNCSIVINDVRESDSGSYQLRVNGLLNGKMDGFTFSLRAALSVKSQTQKLFLTVPPLTEGQPATLTCTAPGLCSGSKPQITWMWGVAGEKNAHISGNITAETKTQAAVTHTHSSSLTFNPSAEHHNTNITCKVNFVGGRFMEETVTLHVNLDCGSQSGILPWVIAGVSLSMNVCCVICMCYFWNAKQKVKPTQEDRAYMSLKKRDPSAEYEVIGPHRTDSSLHPAR